MKKLIAGLLLCASSAASASVGLKYFYSEDNDKNSTVRTTVTGWTNSGFGVAVTRGYHRTSTLNRHSTSVEGAVQYSSGRFTADGTLGATHISNKTLFSGDLGMTVKVAEPLIINAAVFGDLVDSTPGLTKGLSYAGASVGPEYQGNGWGALANVRAVRFTNNNMQTGGNAKVYKDVASGVNVFVAAKTLSNDRPNNGDYWSPDSYRRTTAGIGFRKHTEHWRLTASAEMGPAVIDNSSQVSSSFRASAARSWGDWTARVIAGADNADGTSYRYRYLSGTAILRF